MNRLHTWAAAMLVLGFALAFTLALPAQPVLTPEQVANLQLVTNPPPRGTFWVWSYARSNVFSLNPFPFNPFPADVPVYALDASRCFLVDNDPGDLTFAQQQRQSQQALDTPQTMSNPSFIPPFPTNTPPPGGSSPFPPSSTNGLPLLTSIPRSGNFYSLQHPDWPPLPCDPFPDRNVYWLGTNLFLLDDLGAAYPAPPPPGTNSNSGPQSGPSPDGHLSLDILSVSNGIANLILWGTTNGESYSLLSAEKFQTNQTWLVEQDIIGASGTNGAHIQVPTFGRRNLFFWAHTGPDSGPRVLFVQILGIANGLVNLGIYGTSPAQTYEILSKQDLGEPEWASEGTVAGQTNWTSATVVIGTRTNSLFLQARCWMDSDGSGLPDWWQLKYFGQTGVDPYADPDGDGWSNLQEFQNGTHPKQFNTPPAPTGLTVKYYGPSSNVVISWNPSPGPVTNYVVARVLLYWGGTNSSVVPSNQTTLLDSLPDNPYRFSFPETYQVRAEYPGGFSAWSDLVSIYSPNNSPQVVSGGGESEYGVLYVASTTANASVVRGPLGNLYLVTGHLPPGVVTLRVSNPGYEGDAGTYPPTIEANYLWEVPRPWTNAAGSNYWEVSASALQSGYCQLPAWLVPPYGYYELDVRAVGSDGTLADCRPICGYSQDDWTWQWGAVPFLDGRTQIQQNVEFQLRAAQGRAIWSFPPYPNLTNEVPFGLVQSACNDGWQHSYSESAAPDYVCAGFHYYHGYGPNGWGSAGASLLLDAFRPFEQNYLYANFTWSLPPWGTVQQGDIPYCGGRGYNTPIGLPYKHALYDPVEVDRPAIQFSVNDFIRSGATNPIGAILTGDATQWLFLDQFMGGAGDVLGTFADQSRTNAAQAGYYNYVVYADFPNLYGLRLLSVNAVSSQSNSAPWSAPFQFRSYSPGPSVVPPSDRPAFLEVERPQLRTVDYYFARTHTVWTLADDGCGDTVSIGSNLDPRPGEPNFSVNAATPAMFAPFGEPFFVTAWAKQAITNGFADKFAFPEQYFAGAYTIGPNGNVTTNEAGILSPYGEFFPTVPGPVGLVTMPDAATGSQGTGVVNVIKLQLDVNHDGTMDLSFGGPDNTSQSRPFMFWINNDCDYTDMAGDPSSGSGYDAFKPSEPDFAWSFIHSVRDLEDLARLWICGVPALTNGAYQLTLSWTNVSSGTPTIKLFRAAETNGGTGYLADPNVGAAQVAWTGFGGAGFAWPIATVSPSSPFTFPANYFTNGANKYFLFEGCTNGTGELVLTITQDGTNIVAQTGAWLDLHDVKDMFDHVLIENVTDYSPNTFLSTYRELNSVDQASDEEKKVIVFVHGWRMGEWDYKSFSETMFKRLYWQGFRGRFVSIRWPTKSKDDFKLPLFDYATYNESELRAFKSARGVSDYLNHLKQERFPDYTINVCAHSMGNIVMMEALRRDLHVGRANINNYVLMQAAVPAHCYDTSLPNYAPFISAEQAYATPDTYHGYPGAISAAVRNRIINFYNTNDFALATAIVGNWEQNQRLFKPNSSKGYTSDGTSGFKDGVVLTENREVMSFVARPRSKAVGAQPGVGGVLTSLDQVDLKGSFSFDTGWDEHSAQFNWNIQRLNAFYAELLAKLFSEP